MWGCKAAEHCVTVHSSTVSFFCTSGLLLLQPSLAVCLTLPLSLPPHSHATPDLRRWDARESHRRPSCRCGCRKVRTGQRML
mmetsp:Transcript_82296/g.120623  ORF Transcript_82296/g.120623 Transcript_82296/m.120623 type:complete len:82 (+) Transcript_82296:307-552(+)